MNPSTKVCCSVMARAGLVAALICLAAPRLNAVELLYDFENDSGDVITDKLVGDGTQNGGRRGNVSFQTDPPGIVPFGLQSARFDPPDPLPAVPPFSTIEIPDTVLGSDFSLTLAMHVANLESDLTRLFSSFRGTGSVSDNRVVFDYDASGSTIPGVRAIVGNTVVGTAVVPPSLALGGYHHFAMTVDAGNVAIYVDGGPVAAGIVPAGYSNSLNLRIGEDPHDSGGTANEQLLGNVDDVLVIDQALDPLQIASLASGMTVQSVVTPTGSLAVNYDFEADSGMMFTDKFASDGSQDGIAHVNADVDTVAANAAEGLASGRLRDPLEDAILHRFSKITTPITGTDLGSQFTMSAVINFDGGGFSGGGRARLFSTYAGTGSVSGRLILDFSPSGAGAGIRLILPDGTNVSSTGSLATGENHTVTAVYDEGDLSIYLDGAEVVVGSATAGAVDLGSLLLQIGEDLGGAVNENFVGTLDDVLILPRPLSAKQVGQLHARGAAAFLAVPEPGSFALLATLATVVLSSRWPMRRFTSLTS